MFNETLAALRDNYDARINPGASPSALKELKSQLQTEFGLKLPPDLETFLSQANGIITDDFTILYTVDAQSTHPPLRKSDDNNELAAINRIYHKGAIPAHFLILGMGDLGLMVFNQKAKQYELIDEHTYEAMGEHATLQGLIDDIMNTLYGDDGDDAGGDEDDDEDMADDEEDADEEDEDDLDEDDEEDDR